MIAFILLTQACNGGFRYSQNMRLENSKNIVREHRTHIKWLSLTVGNKRVVNFGTYFCKLTKNLSKFTQ